MSNAETASPVALAAFLLVMLVSATAGVLAGHFLTDEHGTAQATNWAIGRAIDSEETLERCVEVVKVEREQKATLQAALKAERAKASDATASATNE